MTLDSENRDKLDNLVKIGKLKRELKDQTEFDGMLNAAIIKLQDASLQALSPDSRFSLAYSAAHAAALAALRWHGYRSEQRYLVFQCLEQTVGFTTTQWRILDECHKRRNLAEYEGHLEVDNALLQALMQVTTELVTIVASFDKQAQ